MKKVTLLVVLFAIATLVGCGGSAVQPALTASTVKRSGTIFVGDSIIGKWDLDSYFPNKGYINAGWFGKRTDEIKGVFPAILDGSNVCHGYIPNAPNPPDPAFPFSCVSTTPPARVVILLGWNNMFQGKPAALAVDDISDMVRTAQAAGVQVVLVVPYRFDNAHPNSWMQPWDSCDWGPFRGVTEELGLNDGIRGLGAQYHVPVLDLEHLFTCQGDYTSDGVHPNANGYTQMTKLFQATL